MTTVTPATDLTVGFLLHTWDLTAFKANCATATTNCVPATYASYEGLGLAVHFADAGSSRETTNNWGACMPNKNCYFVNPTGTDFVVDATL